MINSIKKRKILFIWILICLLFIPLYIIYYTNFVITRERPAIYDKTIEIKYYINKFRQQNKIYPKNLQQVIKFVEKNNFFVKVKLYDKFKYHRLAFIGLSNINILPEENETYLNKDISISIIQLEGYQNLRKELILYYVNPKLDSYRLYAVDKEGKFMKFGRENYYSR